MAALAAPTKQVKAARPLLLVRLTRLELWMEMYGGS